MTTRSKAEIVIESIRTLTISCVDRPRLGWCQACGRQAPMASADQAAILCRTSSRAIYVMIEAGDLHFVETTDGLLMICINSLVTGGERNESRSGSANG